jgi:glycosyltransferase involved in cell wall biosynthesis
MSATVIVDWLGRGGIAQCTAAWADVLRENGDDVRVVTRGGRDLDGWSGPLVHSHERRLRLAAHRDVVRTAVETIATVRPRQLVVQNYVVPLLERPLLRAARRAGTTSILVVHDHHLHSRLAGLEAGMGALVRDADVVVTHSEYVAHSLRQRFGRSDCVVLPLPTQTVQLTSTAGRRLATAPPGGHLALHFGIVRRGYKGTDLVVRIAEAAPNGWGFAIIGRGAPGASPNLQGVDGYVPAADLVATVRHSAATLLPYRFATQSAAVVLAQSLGSVPVVTAVGGLPEQVRDGETGMVVAPDAGIDAWLDALRRLAEPGRIEEMSRQVLQDSADRHRRFVDGARKLAA